MLANEGNKQAEDNTLVVVAAASGKPPLPPSPMKPPVQKKPRKDANVDLAGSGMEHHQDQ
jgi:hypothetical protein